MTSAHPPSCESHDLVPSFLAYSEASVDLTAKRLLLRPSHALYSNSSSLVSSLVRFVGYRINVGGSTGYGLESSHVVAVGKDLWELRILAFPVYSALKRVNLHVQVQLSVRVL